MAVMYIAALLTSGGFATTQSVPARTNRQLNRPTLPAFVLIKDICFGHTCAYYFFSYFLQLYVAY